jgi:hypothetical protein
MLLPCIKLKLFFSKHFFHDTGTPLGEGTFLEGLSFIEYWGHNTLKILARLYKESTAE